MLYFIKQAIVKTYSYKIQENQLQTKSHHFVGVSVGKLCGESLECEPLFNVPLHCVLEVPVTDVGGGGAPLKFVGPEGRG